MGHETIARLLDCLPQFQIRHMPYQQLFIQCLRMIKIELRKLRFRQV